MVLIAINAEMGMIIVIVYCCVAISDFVFFAMEATVDGDLGSTLPNVFSTFGGWEAN